MHTDGAASDSFGWTVGISDDYAIVGAYGDDDNGERSGSAYLFYAGLSGDFNADGVVDAADFLCWQRDPGVGNLADWQASYGAVGTFVAGVQVPEPESDMLFSLFLLSATLPTFYSRACSK